MPRSFSVSLCTVMYSCSCRSPRLLLGPEVTPDTGLEGWENVLWHARALQRCSEDLGAAMYPPQV